MENKYDLIFFDFDDTLFDYERQRKEHYVKLFHILV